MMQIVDREDGVSRKVSILFDPNQKEIRRKSNNRKIQYEYFPSRSKAKPEFHKDANINRIMKKYKKTGFLDPLILRDMKYGDFSSGEDFASMSMRILDAQHEFSMLPAHVRHRFGNDPGQLLDFLADEANYDEAVKLGIVKERDKPVVAPPATPPASAPAVGSPAEPPAATAAAAKP